MKKLSSALAVAVIAAGGLAVPVATASSADATTYHWYSNCTNLHNRWAHGVGRRYAHDHTSGVPVTNFYHSTYWYKRAISRNSTLDRDKDGIACEAH